jgi:hypothetical protein
MSVLGALVVCACTASNDPPSRTAIMIIKYFISSLFCSDGINTGQRQQLRPVGLKEIETSAKRSGTGILPVVLGFLF